jgi:HEAT repeat protein
MEPLLELTRKSVSPNLRRQAMYALVQMGPESFAPLLGALRDRKDDVNYRLALQQLPSVGQNKAAVPHLIEALQHPTPTIRQTAAAALGRIGPEAKDAIPALKTASQDTNAQVRSAASAALKRISP